MTEEIREAFTRNAEEFDALMVRMLAENERLNQENQELRARLFDALQNLLREQGSEP